MSCRWVEGRVPRIDRERLKILCDSGYAPGSSSSSRPPNVEEIEDRTSFRYPANCKGIGEIWRRFASTFPEDTFKYQHKVVRIDPIGKRLVVFDSNNSEVDLSYDVIISTIPLTELGKLTSLCPDIRLKHSKVVLVGIGLKKPQSEFAERLTWAYYSDPKTIFYRCTVISNFSPFMVPDPEEYWSVLCELGFKPDDEVDEKRVVEKTIQNLVTNGLISSETQVHSTWFHILPYGYPIPTLNREDELTKAFEILENHNIYSRGRFGGWKYEISNQDHSFEMGCQLVDRVFLGIPENLYVISTE